MSDRELLELAAKAAGIDLAYDLENGKPCARDMVGGGVFWNPLESDADAFGLVVKLRLDVCRPTYKHEAVCVWVDDLGDFIEEPHGDDPYAATRRALVRAAAEIGKEMR